MTAKKDTRKIIHFVSQDKKKQFHLHRYICNEHPEQKVPVGNPST